MNKEENLSWTIREALRAAAERLRHSAGRSGNRDFHFSDCPPSNASASKDNPSSNVKDFDVAASEAATLLAACMGVEKTHLSLRQEELLSPKTCASFERAIERRVLGEPLQYLVGEAPFRHLSVKTTPAALIPRPETEILVEVGLAHLLKEHDTRAMFRIADIGTGTGNIALSLLQELSDKGQAAMVYASDISSAALALAQENASAFMEKLPAHAHFLMYRPEVLQSSNSESADPPLTDFRHCDCRPSTSCEASLFFLKSDILGDYPQELKGSFDAIFSNPPYLSNKIMETMLPPEVRDYEPALALAGGSDGLDVFRRLHSQALMWLKNGGWLFVELGEENVEPAADILKSLGHWDQVSVTKDLTGRPRVLSAQFVLADPGLPLQ